MLSNHYRCHLLFLAVLAAGTSSSFAQHPANAALLTDAQQKLDTSDFDAAIMDCHEVLRHDPANGEALCLRARARLWNGDRPGALEDCNALLDNMDGDPRACFWCANANEMLGRHDSALQEYSRAIALDPQHIEAYIGRLRILARQSDYSGMARDADTVIALASEAIAAGTNDGSLYRWRGYVRNLRGQIEDASADYTQALELNPRDVWSWLGLARSKQILSDAEGALNDATQAASLAPRLAEAYLTRGSIRDGANDVDGLIADLAAAIQLDPTEPMAYVLRGQALLRRDSAAALADAEEILELNPKDSDGYLLRGLVKKGARDEEGAREDFVQALRLAENSYQKYHRAAEQLKGAYNDKMIALATEALALNPRNDHAYEDRAHAKAWKKDLPGAIADMDAAIAIRDLPQYYYLRGGYRKATGDDAGAQADRDKAIQRVPDMDFPPYPEPRAIPVAVMTFTVFLSAACFLLMAALTVMAHVSLAKNRREVGQWQLTQQELQHLPVTVACASDVKNAHDVKWVAIIFGGIGTTLSSINGILHLANLYGQTNAPWAFPPANPVLLAFLAGICYLTGVRLERSVRRLTITSDEVTLVTPRKGGEERWTQPLANYRGLLGKTGIYTKKNAEYEDRFMEMELLHPDPDRTIPVYREKGSMDSVPRNESMPGRALWKTFAGLLGVDALEQHEGEILTREVEDLGKSAQELVREGKLDAPLDPDAPVPNGVTIHAENGETIVTIAPDNSFELKLMRGVGITMGVCLSMNFILDGGLRNAPFVLAGAAMILLAIGYKPRHTRLRITRESLRVQSVNPRRETTVETLDPSRIKDVRLETISTLQLSLEDALARLKKKPGAPPPIRKSGYLSLITDQKTVVLPGGRGKLPLETAGWLRSFILRMLAAEQPPQPPDHPEATL